MKIALVGGGTGGHVFPLLALYNYLSKDNDFEFIWIGEKNSLEEKIAKENNIKFYYVKSGKLRRYFSFKNFYEPFLNILGFFDVLGILKKEKVETIFLKGGYVSLATSLAGKLLGKKIIIHESDSIPGLSSRMIGKFASKVFLTFNKASKYFLKEKTEVIGQILNPLLFYRPISSFSTGLGIHEKFDKTQLLVTGGSQGSSRIFDFVLNNINELSGFDITVILGTLNTSYKEKFEKYDFVKAYEFVSQEQFAEIYAKTDIAISRAGATTLFELENFGILTFIIPLKGSANDHQFYNALEFEKRGNLVFTEESLNNNLLNKLLKYNHYKKNPDFVPNYKETLKKIEKELKIK
ncbi:MAG: UDP-N-acetylglucosamine--N-acetylmuramyl-(pentapeptide) pyrophosphoryl-undecaprenol N-acetylglucosamine transferase [Candidatus Gracilibacteria bacterium]|nr:UDP-N-acetylglucosamine--N-acetylmuramyl-(pentapeptide) pyrophosphoryl-undecaprenol N-acetylglucosamine transferase [Candidatus Gracilibacteria bacterium]